MCHHVVFLSSQLERLEERRTLSAQRLSRDQDSRFGKRRLSGEPVRSGKRDGVTERQPARAAVSGGASAWKWNSGAKDIVRIVVPLRSDEAARIGAKAKGRAVHVASSQQIRITAAQRHRVKPAKSFFRPLAMALLFLLICTLVRRGQDFNEQMIAAEPEGRGVGGHARGSALEFVGEQGAGGRNCVLHGLN